MPTRTEHIDERELLLRISEGDEVAFRQVYDQYRKRIYSFAFNLTESQDKAGEVVQEVFLKLWLNKHRLSEVTNFSSWLLTIAKNGFFDALKKKANESLAIKNLRLISDDSSNDTDRIIIIKENEAILHKAVDNLPAQQKLVFQLRTEGFKLDEIADKLQISKNTVKVHLNRAVTTLKEHLDKHGDTVLVLLFMMLGEK